MDLLKRTHEIKIRTHFKHETQLWSRTNWLTWHVTPENVTWRDVKSWHHESWWHDHNFVCFQGSDDVTRNITRDVARLNYRVLSLGRVRTRGPEMSGQKLNVKSRKLLAALMLVFLHNITSCRCKRAIKQESAIKSGEGLVIAPGNGGRLKRRSNSRQFDDPIRPGGYLFGETRWGVVIIVSVYRVVKAVCLIMILNIIYQINWLV